MIFSDFRGPGAHFGGLGAHFEDTSDFCDFGDLSAAKNYLLFEVIFRYFLHQIFTVFLSVVFLVFL